VNEIRKIGFAFLTGMFVLVAVLGQLWAIAPAVVCAFAALNFIVNDARRY
jgi:hypothetical protein